jgi:hypothetical protein
VKIDFGDVTMNMRNLLRKMGKKSFRPGNAAAMLMLNATNPETIKLARTAMVGVGFKAQRLAHDVLSIAAKHQTSAPPATVGTAPIKEQVIHFINKKMPGGLPKKTARAAGHRGQGLRAHHPQPAVTTAETEAVFYFPGCGSERLFSQVGLATQAMLWHAGVQTVLPPGYLCCGYPQRGRPVRQGREDHHRQPGAVPPRGQHAELPGHQDGGGELRHLLRPAAGLPVRQDLPGLPHHRHPRVPAGEGHQARRRRRLPVPRPLPHADEAAGPDEDRQGPGGRRGDQERALLRRVRHAGGQRPDISTQVRFRKEEEIRKGEATLRATGAVGQQQDVKILTSCPSCLQGLSRYGDDLQNGLLEADYIVVEMARKILGENWMADYVARANAGGIERVLV